MRRAYRKDIFAIVFFGKPAQFLILHRVKNWRGWEFIKGGVKEGESDVDAVRREVGEEAGARKIRIAARTKNFISYKFPKEFVKDDVMFCGAEGYVFLVEVFNKRVKVDKGEHDRYRWVSKEEMLRLLTHKNQKNALKFVVKSYDLS